MKDDNIPCATKRSCTKRSIRRYGWIPDLPDRRDVRYSAPVSHLTAAPPSTDLRSSCPPVYDQGDLGSCTANAIAGAFEFDLILENLNDFVPSRLFIYYNERVIENTFNTDSGAALRDGIKTISQQGVCPEALYPYVVANFADTPPAGDYTEALNNKALQYMSVAQDLDQMRGCLASGFPFVYGFSVYSSFESPAVATTGVVPMPGPDESIIGGHAVVAVGYDDSAQTFLVRNSWGSDWGMAGYFTMPYAYLTDPNLASDFWTIRLVSEG